MSAYIAEQKKLLRAKHDWRYLIAHSEEKRRAKACWWTWPWGHRWRWREGTIRECEICGRIKDEGYFTGYST